MANKHLNYRFAGAARLVVFSSLVAIGQLVGQEEGNRVFHWNSVLPAGKTVVVHGVNGSVSATLSAGRELQVEAMATGAAADQVKVALVETPEGVFISAVTIDQPTTRGARDKTDFPYDARVDFRLQLPAGVVFVVRNVNGTVKATAVKSSVDATTGSGDVSISTTEAITSAQTGNGSLDLAMGKLWSGLLTIKTENGNIRLELPRNASFRPSSKGNVLIGGGGPVRLKGVVVGKGESRRAAAELELFTPHGKVTLKTQD